MFHTQERRSVRLVAPLLCTKENAWLGDGYYFWDDIKDAILWGNNSKRETGMFEIYSANFNMSNFLDTVFNENHYNFWKIK